MLKDCMLASSHSTPPHHRVQWYVWQIAGAAQLYHLAQAHCVLTRAQRILTNDVTQLICLYIGLSSTRIDRYIATSISAHTYQLKQTGNPQTTHVDRNTEQYLTYHAVQSQQECQAALASESHTMTCLM